MTDMPELERTADVLERFMDETQREVYRAASDSTDLRDVIRRVRTIISCLSDGGKIDYSLLLRALGLLCTAANLQERLHGGERASDRALHEAAEAVLRRHEGNAA